MSDFVDRVLGLPDPSAVRPRLRSFFDLPPVLDPPPPGAESQEEAAAGARPLSDAPATTGSRAARTARHEDDRGFAVTRPTRPS
ncbi:hypothetical protein [Streptomyces sp. AB3(2024)]|uniref:hypothetical protein n=1 Tax=Streptomyces sp. AB3(2024) TaxID=3317321 RepID=UPI0035A38109